jgi:excisionase family DNA binding protein
MTGNVEHTKRMGANAAWAEASASLVKAEDILTPEELATRLKVPDSWVYEKTRGRCRNPIPCLRLGRYVRFDWTAVATWLTAPAPPGNPSNKSGSYEPPESGTPCRPRLKQATFHRHTAF